MTSTVVAAIRILDIIPLSVIALVARVIIGLVFFKSGLTKIDGFALKDATFYLFAEEYKVPLLPPVLAAYMATAAELTMPLLLWAGLGARFAAVALLAMTAVIQTFVYPDAYMTHGLWAIALLLIVKYGAGSLSLDHLIRQWFEAQWQSPAWFGGVRRP
jgi:putative oxidoreductase